MGVMCQRHGRNYEETAMGWRAWRQMDDSIFSTGEQKNK